jgi:hypothetical protein
MMPGARYARLIMAILVIIVVLGLVLAAFSYPV